MPNVQFKRGEFRTYRATTKIHLGAFKQDIFEDETFDTDGFTLRWQGEEKPLGSLRGGIEAGWFLEDTDNTSQGYVPGPAGVQVHAAESSGFDRGTPVTMGTAQEEEVVVGSVDAAVRQREQAAQGAYRTTKEAAPQPAPAPQAAPPAPQATPGAAPAVTVGPSPQAPIEGGQAVVGSGAPRMAMTDQTPAYEERPPAPAGQRPQPRRRALSVDEADAINSAQLEAALAGEVVVPDRTGIEPGVRRDSVEEDGQTVGQGGKFQLVMSDGDQGGQVVKTLGGQPGVGAQVGSQDQARREALRQGTDVTRVGAAHVKAAQKPIGGTRPPQVPPEFYQQETPAPPAAPPVQAEPPVEVTPPQTGAAPTGARMVPEGDPIETSQGAPPPVVDPETIVFEGDEGAEDINATHESGATGDVGEALAGDELSDLLPDAASSGVPEHSTTSDAAADAKVVSEGWDTSQPWQTQVRTALQYADQPKVINAICKKVTPAVRKHIRSGVVKHVKAKQARQ